jgi:hypothetical protein
MAFEKAMKEMNLEERRKRQAKEDAEKNSSTAKAKRFDDAQSV